MTKASSKKPAKPTKKPAAKAAASKSAPAKKSLKPAPKATKPVKAVAKGKPVPAPKGKQPAKVEKPLTKTQLAAIAKEEKAKAKAALKAAKLDPKAAATVIPVKPGSKIPARPYLGVSQVDRQILLMKIRAYLLEATGKAPS